MCIRDRSWSYRQTAPTTWFRFITGEAARLEKAPSWYSLEKASLPRRAETTSPMRAYFPRAEAVSYTHLDVYKRQNRDSPVSRLSACRGTWLA